MNHLERNGRINQINMTNRRGVETETAELEHHIEISTRQELMQRLCSCL